MGRFLPRCGACCSCGLLPANELFSPGPSPFFSRRETRENSLFEIFQKLHPFERKDCPTAPGITSAKINPQIHQHKKTGQAKCYHDDNHVREKLTTSATLYKDNAVKDSNSNHNCPSQNQIKNHSHNIIHKTRHTKHFNSAHH